MARPNTLVKIVLALGVLAGVGVMFVRSVRNTGSQPYTVASERLGPWTLAFDPGASTTGGALVLRTSPDLVRDLFRQVFMRSGLSLSGPSVSEVPLLLKTEFDRAFADRTTPDALIAAARSTGLDGTTLTPRCLASRRVSAPGVTQQLFFVIFDIPAFVAFREQIRTLADGNVAAGASYDPAALTPVLIVAAADSAFDRWLPLRADPATDCVAPLVVGSS